MATQGVDKLMVARLNSDSGSGLIYDTFREYKNSQELTLKPKFNTDSAYSDNRVCDTDSVFDSLDITWGRYGMTSSEDAYVTGKPVTSTGGVVLASGGEIPYIGIMYSALLRRKKTNGNPVRRYGIVYKAQVSPADDSYKTLQGKPDLSQTPSLSGTGIATDWFFINSDGLEIHPCEFHIDDDDPSCPENIATAWWTGAYIPAITAPATLSMTANPANNATGTSTGVSPTLTFNNAIAVLSGITLMKSSDNSIVSTTVSLDSTGKIATVAPTAALSASTAYLLVISGVTDCFGQVLPTTTVKFTTGTT